MTLPPYLAKTPEPPYFAVIFTSKRTARDPEGYDATADTMVEMAARMDGYLGMESTRSEDGTGITVSYWRDEAAIAAWRTVSEHLTAQKQGRENWYDSYHVRIARVTRAYSFYP